MKPFLLPHCGLSLILVFVLQQYSHEIVEQNYRNKVLEGDSTVVGSEVEEVEKNIIDVVVLQRKHLLQDFLYLVQLKSEAFVFVVVEEYLSELSHNGFAELLNRAQPLEGREHTLVRGLHSFALSVV